MLPFSALRPRAIPGCPVVVEPFSASLRGISTPERPGTSEIIDTQTELQTASTLTDRAGHEFLYALSHSCACPGLHDLILALELLLVLKAALVLSVSGITNHHTTDMCLCLMTRGQQRSAQI